MQNASVFKMSRPLVLASGSPRRQEMLKMLGLEFSIVLAPTEESPLPGEKGEDYALRAAKAKASSVCALVQKSTGRPPAVLAADTVVLLGEQILGKPQSHAHALEMLRSLAGKTHRVVTACALSVPDFEGVSAFFVESLVSMWQAPDEQLVRYAAMEEPMDKAGSYAVQGAGAFLIEKIQGSWTSVVGLPLQETVALLLKQGVIC